MTWPETTVKDWSEFSKLADGMTVELHNMDSYVLRGQADASWPLTPSLVRLLPDGISAEDAIRIETRATNEFHAQAHLFLKESLIPELFHRPRPEAFHNYIGVFDQASHNLFGGFCFQIKRKAALVSIEMEE